jgi:Predicted integral membrane protein linked to a cation pump
MSAQQAPGKPFNGWHMTAILAAGFGVVVGVNLTMARLASSTFGGVVVDNSYVASQHYNRWLDEAKAERAMGWTVDVSRRDDAHVAVRLAGAPDHAVIEADARHPLGRRPDMVLSFAPDTAGTYVSREVLPEGRWHLRLAITADGRTWHGEDQVEGREVIGAPQPQAVQP